VGEAQNEPREEEWEAATANKTLIQASEYIIPNAPENMIRLAEHMAEQKGTIAQTLLYSGKDETTFRKALHSLPFETKDCCICFRRLNAYLTNCGWYGAAIYTLTRPFAADFMDIIDTSASPLIHYETTSYFTLASLSGGQFPDLANNPLKPILERYFGPDLDMKQTLS